MNFADVGRECGLLLTHRLGKVIVLRQGGATVAPPTAQGDFSDIPSPGDRLAPALEALQRRRPHNLSDLLEAAGPAREEGGRAPAPHAPESQAAVLEAKGSEESLLRGRAISNQTV